MSDRVFHAVLERLAEYCQSSGQNNIDIAFHGGEPCLIGAKTFDRWCKIARDALRHIASVRFTIQTNGTLLDGAWVRAFKKHRVDVGISVDGGKDTHDRFRIDHAGRGSYDRVQRGLGLLRDADIPYGVLCVIPLGADPIVTHRTFIGIGCSSVTYLLPHYTHDNILPVRQQYGLTPCADFLVPIFDEWWLNGTMDLRVQDLSNIARIILGGRSKIETLGATPPLYIFVEPDGEIEGLDNLRACEDGLSSLNLNVLTSGFDAISRSESMHRKAIFEGMPLPTLCRNCRERETCAGGYLPHRYSRARGFDNPSVWCNDLLRLFDHIRDRLGVTAAETRTLREALNRKTSTPSDAGAAMH